MLIFRLIFQNGGKSTKKIDVKNTKKIKAESGKQEGRRIVESHHRCDSKPVNGICFLSGKREAESSKQKGRRTVESHHRCDSKPVNGICFLSGKQ